VDQGIERRNPLSPTKKWTSLKRKKNAARFSGKTPVYRRGLRVYWGKKKTGRQWQGKRKEGKKRQKAQRKRVVTTSPTFRRKKKQPITVTAA